MAEVVIPDRADPRHGVRIDARDLRKSVKGGRCVLHDVTFAVEPGQVVAIVGGSGAGKTTLLEVLAGVRPADGGSVRFDGVNVHEHLDEFRTVLGYVPQEDIIHAELPLERTVRYAAALRLPQDSSRASIDASVKRVLAELDLAAQADVRVGALSGGQRKRASIAVELLTEPHVFFLDEPTSGLDPATAAELLAPLRRLADGGSTVLFTTHAVQDLSHCDRLVFLARGGYLAFEGTPDEALASFRVDGIEAIYERLERRAPEEWAAQFRATRPAIATAESVAAQLPERRARAGFARQRSVLTRRTFETLQRNRLTMVHPARVARDVRRDVRHPLPAGSV